MTQTSKFFGALVIAFIVYITMRGELRAYGSVFFGAPAATASGA